MVMLVGKLNKAVENGYYPDCINNIIDYLSGLPLNSLELGRHEIPLYKSDEAWFVILEYKTEDEVNFQPEVHKNHSDLQIVLSGSERMAWCMDSGTFKQDGDYIQSRDILFYTRENMELNYFTAKEGFFYLFTPSVVHFTNIKTSNASHVRKLVVKINNSILMGSA